MQTEAHGPHPPRWQARLIPCTCLCTVAHPSTPGVCLAEQATVTRTLWTPARGEVCMALCGPCARVTGGSYHCHRCGLITRHPAAVALGRCPVCDSPARTRWQRLRDALDTALRDLPPWAC